MCAASLLKNFKKRDDSAKWPKSTRVCSTEENAYWGIFCHKSGFFWVLFWNKMFLYDIEKRVRINCSRHFPIGSSQHTIRNLPESTGAPHKDRTHFDANQNIVTNQIRCGRDRKFYLCRGSCDVRVTAVDYHEQIAYLVTSHNICYQFYKL